MGVGTGVGWTIPDWLADRPRLEIFSRYPEVAPFAFSVGVTTT
jgi:hypothetical protein